MPRSLTVHAARLPGGLPRGAVLVLHDLTEVRRLEAVRRDFVANVSHELKTPLTSISGYAETLADGGVDPATTKRFLATIVSNAARMQRLVDDLLDLSQRSVWHESGDGRLERITHRFDAVPDCVQRTTLGASFFR